jgi:ribosomal protein S18 acetylase RimI-like enzyme
MVGKPSDFSIRPAEFADCGGIARVHVDSCLSTYQGIVPQSYLEDRSYTVRVGQWTNILSNQNDEECNFVALDSAGAIIGFSRGGRDKEGSSEHLGELYAIYILDQFHNRGIGRRLLKAVVADLLLHGWSSMRIWVLAANPACGFYEYLGGKIVAEKELVVEDVRLRELAYGWSDISAL